MSARAHIITIRRLLNHTAGVPEFVASSEFAQRLAEDVTPGQVVALFFHDSLDFNPGDKWSYSNTDYLLLGMIIEKVTGEPYANVLQQDLFRPLGLRQTSYCVNRPSDPTFADGYSVGSGTALPARYLSMTWVFAAGALCSTVRDLVTWQRALQGGRVTNARSYALMTNPDTLNDGKQLTYGFGLSTGELGGHRQLGHNGGVNGFTTTSLYYPDDNVNVVVFSNADRAGAPRTNGPKRFPSSGADRLALNVARAVFGLPLVADPRP